MSAPQTIWLVANSTSGSNDEAALATLQHCCGDAGFDVARMINFPEQPLPDARALDAAGIDRVAVFAGDGTINALVTRLYGWDGAVLVLPGGTKNLLAIRLHGEAELTEIVHAVAAGRSRVVRPTVVRSRHGDALAGLLAGPGTEWNKVREAMRASDVVRMAEGAVEAIEASTIRPAVRLREPAIGRAQGYPLAMLTPVEGGFEVDGYHAETFGEFVQQSFALVRRAFREGPHDRLGTVQSLVIEDPEGDEVGLLIDGEPNEGAAREKFAVARCEVDLVATDYAR